MVKTDRSRASSRRRAGTSQPISVFGFTRMTRSEALEQVARYLRRSPMHTSALRLIHLFHLDAEELAEAGVPYELLRMLERRL
jgi:hypothetical protein